MKISKIFIYSFILTLGVFPSLMNSADIYEQTRGEGKIMKSLNENIVPENLSLNSSVFIVQTKEEYKDPQIFSDCPNTQKLISGIPKEGLFTYFIYFRFESNCSDDIVYLKNGDEIYKNTAFKIKLNNYSTLFDELSNYSNIGINNELSLIYIDNLKILDKIDNTKQKEDFVSKIKLLGEIYKQRWNEYENILLSNIISSRTNIRYISPINGKAIPTRKNIMPNAPRKYRAQYTDGVHHGWDIFTNKGTPVIALADGIIVRIADNFSRSDFDKILWKNLTNEDRATNLDTYRGNQVWLKTIDGNIAIYAHLENISKDINQGDFVRVGTVLGQVGRTGVPDKEYKDFHLHFEIQINPHTELESSFLDIMEWPFFGKGESYNQIISEQTKLFKN